MGYCWLVRSIHELAASRIHTSRLVTHWWCNDRWTRNQNKRVGKLLWLDCRPFTLLPADNTMHWKICNERRDIEGNAESALSVSRPFGTKHGICSSIVRDPVSSNMLFLTVKSPKKEKNRLSITDRKMARVERFVILSSSRLKNISIFLIFDPTRTNYNNIQILIWNSISQCVAFTKVNRNRA